MHLAMAFPSEPTNDNTLVPSIEREFNRFILRSDETFRIAQRRPNALLIVGTAVAISGLLFFIVTLPGFVIDREARGEIVSINDIYRTLFDLTPRLLMLVFIQLLAGFFLRQYRVSMEDLRYFEAVLRGREAQFVSYCILSGSAGDKLAEFAASLAESKDREFLRLQQGETTVVLETQKIEANEFKTLAEKLFDFTKSLAQRGPGDKPAPS
jgi:transcriptional antiterminator Rof (Rho-off)